MGRIVILLAAVSLAAMSAVEAKEIRQVAPGITMAPGLPTAARPKQSEPAPVPVQTSKSEPTTYGAPVVPALPVAEVQPPQPSQPAVNMTGTATKTVTPVAASAPAKPEIRNPQIAKSEIAATTAVYVDPAAEQKSQQKIVRAPREPRQPRVGDRIPDSVKLDAIPVRVGDRIPDNVQLYPLPPTAVR